MTTLKHFSAIVGVEIIWGGKSIRPPRVGSIGPMRMPFVNFPSLTCTDDT